MCRPRVLGIRSRTLLELVLESTLVNFRPWKASSRLQQGQSKRTGPASPETLAGFNMGNRKKKDTNSQISGPSR
jgi:hypothetical protein